MPTLAPNKPIEQRSSQLAVSNRLPVGKHRFELVVIDDAGQASLPRQIVVEVVRKTTGPVIPEDILRRRRRFPDPLRDRVVVPPIRR